MATHPVRYHAYLPDDPSSLTVQCPIGDGVTVERTCRVNDLIFILTPSDLQRGLIYGATPNGLVLIPQEPGTGDLIVTICPATDIPEQSGNISVICTDGTITTLTATTFIPSIQSLTSSATPTDIFASIVVADTTQGDVVGVLPDATIVRRILVGNTTGSGSFQINPVEGQTIGGESTLVLGPSDRATLVATGTGWEVW